MKLNAHEHPVGTRAIIDNNPHGSVESFLEITVLEWSGKGMALLKYRNAAEVWIREMPEVVEVME